MEEQRERQADEYLGRTDKRVARQLRQISRLTGQRYSLQEEVQQLRAELAQYRAQQTPQEQTGQQPPSGEDNSQPQNGQAPAQPHPQAQQPQPPQPRPWGQFTAEELQAFEKKQTEGMATFPYRYQAAKQKYPDFEETITKATNVELPIAVIDALKVVPEGPDVAYYLGKNPAVAKELNADWQSGDAARQKRVCDRLDYICERPEISRGSSAAQASAFAHARTDSALSGGPGAAVRSVYDQDIDYQTHKKLMNEKERRR